ncbi:MAG: phage tail tape measure protein [Synergistaceae bacterium]|nr:phage tail tape measure protein [Synergistaceae bacterium]
MGKIMEFSVSLSMLTSGNFNSAVPAAVGNIQKLSQQVQNLQRVSGNITGFQKQTQKLEVLRQKLSQAQAKVKDFQARRRQGEIIDPKAFTRANEEAARLQKLVQENSRTLGKFRDELKAAEVDTKDLAGAQSKLQLQTERAKAAQDRLNAAQNRYTQLREQFSWSNIRSDVMKSAAIIAAFKQPVTVAMNFDQAMAQVRAVKTMTSEEFGKLETQAMELGATTVYSATQAANTQENLARAGMSIKDITAAMPAVLSMAGAEGMDLAQAGSIIADSLGGMNLEGKFAGRLADVLAYTSASSNTNIAEIGEAFKAAAPVLSQQGATMEQIASYIGVMANKGYKGGEAGNALASTAMRLAELPTKAKAMLKGIGIDPDKSFQTKEGRMAELPEIMRIIDKAMTSKKLGEKARLGIISTVFGKSQGKAMSAFMQASSAGDADLMQNGVYNDSFGKAAEMNRTRNNTLKGDITSLSSAWEGLMIAIGKPLDAVNRSAVQVVTELLQKTTKFINENKTLMRVLLRAGYLFGGMKVLGTVLKYGTLLVKLPFAKLAVWGAAANAEAAAAGSSIGLIGKVLGGLLHPITSLKAGFSGLWGLALAHPFGAILTAGLGLLILIAKWDDLKAWWDSWTIEDVWAMLPKWAQEDLEACKKWFTDIYDWIKEKFSKLNPFNWELPSWMGGGTLWEKQGQVNNANAALQGYTPPSVAPGKPIITHSGGTGQFNAKPRGAQAHALGGIFTVPHIGLVAEAGPEAIIPLKDKSRGIPLAQKAMQALGMTMPEIPSLSLPKVSLPELPSLSLPKVSLPEMPQILGNISAPQSILSEAGQVINQGNIFTQAKEMINNVSQSSDRVIGGNNAVRDSSMTFRPTYNITVNGEGGASGIAENIRQVIEDTMNELMSRMERVSFA